MSFLLAEMGCHVCVKLNPTLLGYEEIEHLLHDVLGYREIQLIREAFDKDLQFDEALDMIPRLQRVARAHGRSLSVKFSNTLVVKNHKQFFTDEVMYLSGAPLHVMALNLVQKFRERHARAGSDFVFRRPGRAQHRRHGGHELRPGHHLHRSAAPRRLWRG